MGAGESRRKDERSLNIDKSLYRERGWVPGPPTPLLTHVHTHTHTHTGTY